MATQMDGIRKKSNKLVVVGDGMCGKTCLLFAFKDDQFIPTHDATIFETYATQVQVNGKTINLNLFDTAGQEDYGRLRALSYADTNIVLVCFSVDSPVSAISVIENWMPEVREFCPRCPVILVACKIDLRNDPQVIETLRREGEKPVTNETGKQIAARIRADAYMECSAKTREGVQELFVHAAGLSRKKRLRKGADDQLKPMKTLKNHASHYFTPISIAMSLLILSFDISSDQIGAHIHSRLNSSLSSNYPHIASFCSFNQLFSSSTHDYEKIFTGSLKTDCLSHNDLLGFVILIDIATTNKLHLQHLSSITALLFYLTSKHPFQPILTFIVHASSSNQLYTSSLTCFNLSLILLHIYPFVNGIVFNNIDQINEHELYHRTIAEQIASIFLPVSSLREDKKRSNISVCIEFLQFIQHLLNNPDKKILIMMTGNFKKLSSQLTYASLLIQRGKPSLLGDEMPLNNLDVWHSLEKDRTQLQSTLILNSDQLKEKLLEKLILQPYRRKMAMNKAYLYWLRKKFDVTNLEEQLNRGALLCESILSDK